MKLVRKECMKPTSEEWYPNYPGDTVRVAMMLNEKPPHGVNVWGNDDTGMELWTKDRGIVRQLYKKICEMKDVTRAKLEKLGLRRA
jgi:hypothetical protein